MVEPIYVESSPLPQRSSSNTEIFTVADVAGLLKLSPLRSKGKMEYHGANPMGGGATEDGFILYEEGNAWDRSTDTRYSSVEVAKMAGIDPDSYEPYKNHTDKNGKGFGSSTGSRASTPAPAKNFGGSNPSAKKEPKVVDNRDIEERGITKATMEHFGITRGRESWIYPTFSITGKPQCYREKFYDPVLAGKKYSKNGKPIKHRWQPGDTGGNPKAYNLRALKGAKEVWIVNGEMSVWSMHQAGKVAISPFGEGRMIEAIVEECKNAHVQRIHIAFDNDPTGHKATFRAVQRAEILELSYNAYKLQGKSGADISDYYEQAGYDTQSFIEALKIIPVMTPEQVAAWGDEVPEKDEEVAKPKDRVDEKVAKSEQLGKMLIDDGARPFYTNDNSFYLVWPRKGIDYVYPMEDSNLGYRLSHYYFDKTGKMIDNAAMEIATRTLKGYALENNFIEEVWIRSAWHEGHIYIDLARDDNATVKIGPECEDGWETTNNPPVYFRRPKGFWPLPIPVRGGDINELRPLINAVHDDDWMLMVSWMVNSMFPPTASFPVLAINGEQGSAKSTTCRILKKIVDPNFTPLIGSSVRDERDLAITARNCYVIGFDNLSGLSKWQSDALCQIATGQGFRTRKLHTDDEEILFNAKRPMIVNGIEPLLGREDFRNRCLVCSLPPIPKKGRLEEHEINDRVDALCPSILGWIFEVMSVSIKNFDNVKLKHSPRMADFARRIVAGESAMPWEAGKFEETLNENIADLVDLSLENSPLANEIVRLMEDRSFHESTVTELMEMLNTRAKSENRNADGWPRNKSFFSSTLQRISPGMRENGINITHGRTGKGRFIKIMKMTQAEMEA